MAGINYELLLAFSISATSIAIASNFSSDVYL